MSQASLIAGVENAAISDDATSSSSSSEASALANEALVHSLAATESRLPAPIDLNVNRAQQITLDDLRWENYGTPPTMAKLTNSGETLLLSALWSSGARPTVQGGALSPRRYVFSQLQFHWGPTALEGSEHTIDGYRLPLELHVIHFDEQLGSQDKASRVPGGLLSVVYFFRLQSTSSRFVAPIVAGLERVRFPGSHTQLPGLPLDELVHTFSGDYFLYWGSTRGPPERADPRLCPMLWIVSRTQERIGFHQLKQFNQLLDGRMRPNHPPEPLTPAPIEGRHLFHVNPRTPMAVATLSLDPPAKCLKARWLVDRLPVDWSSAEACREFVRLVREELAQKRKQLEDENPSESVQ